MLENIGRQLQVRGLLLGSVPLAWAGSRWWGSSSSSPWQLAGVPVAVLLVLDVLACWDCRRRFDAAVDAFRRDTAKGTSAADGRDRMKRLTPPKTGKRYLVVGTGGVGRRIVEVLRQRGEEEVFGFDARPASAAKDFLDEHRCFRGDVGSLRDCRAVLEEFRPDVVYHTAAVITYAERAPHQWPKSHAVNTRGVEHMLRAAAEAGNVEAFVLTSSSTAGLRYPDDCHKRVHGGEDRFPPCTGEAAAFSWYTRSKAMAEEVVLKPRSSGPPAVGIVRPASLIFHARDGLLCTRSLSDLRATFAGFEDSIYDAVYVDNVVLGHLLLEQKLLAGECHGETFLVSNGAPESGLSFSARMAAFLPAGYGFSCARLPPTLVFVLCLLVEAGTALRVDLPKDLASLSFVAMRLAKVDYTMDDARARRLLGYEPAFSVGEGLLQTIEDHPGAFPGGALAQQQQQQRHEKPKRA